MSISIEMTPQEIAAIKQLTNLDDDAQAIVRAAREFLRMRRLRELKAASGKVDFELDWEALERLELGECDFPE